MDPISEYGSTWEQCENTDRYIRCVWAFVSLTGLPRFVLLLLWSMPWPALGWTLGMLYTLAYLPTTLFDFSLYSMLLPGYQEAAQSFTLFQALFGTHFSVFLLNGVYG